MPIARWVFLALALIAIHTPARAQGFTVVAVGDIGTCTLTARYATARLAKTLVSNEPSAILLLGDIAYPRGSAKNFRQCFDPAWGDLKPQAWAVPGNHEYLSAGAGPYFDYFGPRGGPRGKGYYALKLSGWLIIGLNTNCAEVGGCGPGSPQYRWLSATLEDTSVPCQLAFGHHPRLSSGLHGENRALAPIWNLLRRHRVELFLAGHDHDYERLEPKGEPRQFVVGTGGAWIRPFGRIHSASKVRVRAHGVLELTLWPGEYRWRFVDVQGQVRDEGRGRCTSE